MSLPRQLMTGCGALLLAACTPERDRQPPADPPPAVAPAPQPPPAPPAPIVRPPLGRVDLIEGARDAADALVGGTPYPEAVTTFSGRDFRLVLPFGCAGPAPEAGLGYSLDPETRVLKLQARPQVWTETPWAEALSAPEAAPEAVEGFWIRRPWLTGEGCPAQPFPAEGAPASPETLGLAQVFGEGGSRLLRRGDRPYEATRKLAPEEPEPAGGFRLVLEGRVVEAADRPIRCRSESPDQRPVCLLLVQFRRVAFETGDGTLIEDWTS